ncbi:MAG: hypothetical protein M1426_03535 [Patescibacteria group bacterium]|nr:hypothetical protein [Patescibacteria group bacterium]
MKIVVGLVGEKGSGKETFGNILKGICPQKNIDHIHLSDILVETLDLWNVPKTRSNLQILAQHMEKFGKGTLSNAVKKRVEGSRAEIVIIDGIRWESDLEMLKSFPKSLLVYITADLNLRYQRTKLRGEKAFEETTSFEQFLKEEKAKNEVLIPKIGKNADFKVINNGNLEDLKVQVENFAERFLGSLDC